MLDLDQRVLAAVEPQEPPAHELPSSDIERDGDQLGDQSLGLLPLGRRGKLEEIDPRQAHRRRGVHDLAGPAVDRRETGAQHLVPAHDFGEGALEDIHLERASQPEDGLEVVGQVPPRLELIEEPDALLGERQEQGPPVARYGPQGGQLGQINGECAPRHSVDRLRQLPQGGMAEEIGERHLDAEPLADARERLSD